MSESVFIPVVHYHYDSTEPIGGSGTDDPIPAFATFAEAEAMLAGLDRRVAAPYVWEIELPQGFQKVHAVEGDLLP